MDDRLLRNSEHENNYARMGRLASSQIPNVLLEALEESANKVNMRLLKK